MSTLRRRGELPLLAGPSRGEVNEPHAPTTNNFGITEFVDTFVKYDYATGTATVRELSRALLARLTLWCKSDYS
jgi:hypothetical protein